MLRSLVGSEMCIRDSSGGTAATGGVPGGCHGWQSVALGAWWPMPGGRGNAVLAQCAERQRAQCILPFRYSSKFNGHLTVCHKTYHFRFPSSNGHLTLRVPHSACTIDWNKYQPLLCPPGLTHGGLWPHWKSLPPGGWSAAAEKRGTDFGAPTPKPVPLACVLAVKLL